VKESDSAGSAEHGEFGDNSAEAKALLSPFLVTELSINRPFLMIVLDKSSQTFLFLGKIQSLFNEELFAFKLL